MSYSAKENANNHVGRNSGAGPDGITRLVPTEREAARGLRPISIEHDHHRRRLGLGVGAGALALLGAGAAWYRARQRPTPRGMRARLNDFIGRA
jgi:hypothetical protein